MNESLQYPDDQLDLQIRAALQVEDLPHQLASLQQFWDRRCRRQKRRRVVMASALAATILAALTLSARFHGRHEPRRPAPAAALHRPSPAVAAAHSEPVTPLPAASMATGDEPSPASVRPPTTYEQLVFTARSPSTARLRTVASAVARMIDRAGSGDEAGAAELSRECGLQQPAIEEELLRRLARARRGEIRVLLRLLAASPTPRSAQPLLLLAEDAEFRAEALAIVEQSVGTARLPDMVRRSPDPNVRKAICRRLLTTGDETSLRAYLTLIREPTFAPEALPVADNLPQPVLDALVACLDDDDDQTRLAAALVLGRANGPLVTQELIRRVTASEPPTGLRETWIALLACRGRQADLFLAYASREPKLLGPLYRTRMWWETRIPLWYVVAFSG